LNSTEEAGAAELRRKKNIVGIVAIVLLVVFTFLALFGILSGWGWVIADLIVAAVANLILRRIGRPKEL
jgi:hypothetical protein